jgi:hydroxyacylglutathione hydrolase
MKDTQNFTAQRLPNGVTEITDLSGVHCFLVEGRDKALLIDTMTGLRGLPAFVATLTDLPVEVALTHGHMDHAGGVFEFGRCYIHPADIPMLDGRTLPARVGYVRGQLPPGEAPEASAFVPDDPVEFVPLKAGDKLDLGGRALEVLHVPGHTRGSLCYLDTASGDFFAGDACNNNTLLMMDVSATIEEYLGALLALKERQGDIRRFYLFHGPSLQDKSCIDDNIQCCRDILAGTDDRVPVDFLGRPGYLAKERTPGTFSRKDGRFGNVVYNPQQVRKG